MHENNNTWMEKTVSTPFWTGLTLLAVDQRSVHHGRKRHLLQGTVYQHASRTSFKGQVFSALMDWNQMLVQLDRMENDATPISLPFTGEVLATRVKISIFAGLVDLNKVLKEATVRRHTVVQLISCIKMQDTQITRKSTCTLLRFESEH